MFQRKLREEEKEDTLRNIAVGVNVFWCATDYRTTWVLLFSLLLFWNSEFLAICCFVKVEGTYFWWILLYMRIVEGFSALYMLFDYHWNWVVVLHRANALWWIRNIGHLRNLVESWGVLALFVSWVTLGWLTASATSLGILDSFIVKTNSIDGQ